MERSFIFSGHLGHTKSSRICSIESESSWRTTNLSKGYAECA